MTQDAPKVISEMPRVEYLLRKLLAHRLTGPLGYYDDAELQDNSQLPFIDFLRDHPKDIELKLAERATRSASASKTCQ